MLSSKVIESVLKAVTEVTNQRGKRVAEVATRHDTGFKSIYGFPLVLDASVPPNELHVGYTDEAGNRRITKVIEW